MFVCVCNAVTDRQIEQAAAEGVRGIKGLCLATRAGTTCGKCLPEAKRILDSTPCPCEAADGDELAA